MNTDQKPGITLIELIIALGIVILIAAASMPGFYQVIARNRLTGALERVANDLRYAQSLAVTEGNLHRLLVDGAGRYRLERNTGAWAQLSAWYTLSSEYQGSVLQSVLDNGGANVTNVTFNALGAIDTAATGAASYPVTFTVATPSGMTRIVQVWRSGLVRIP